MGKRRAATPLPQAPKTLHGAFAAGTLDLHGDYADAARARTESFIRRWAARDPGAVVEIVTGKGLNSEGAPVLFGMVRDLLDDELAHLVDEVSLNRGGGGWLVRLRRR